jgi:hypothetical protein
MGYCAPDFRSLLQSNGLSSFQSLWDLELEAVDNPNVERGGWSLVYRFELGGQAFYMKRQSNHRCRSWQRPLGEPTFSREFRNIDAYRNKGVAALDAVFYDERKHGGEHQAILITRALVGYQEFSSLLKRWSKMEEAQTRQAIKVVAQLIGNLHRARMTHHCLYPRHVYVDLSAQAPARLIDLEKTRYQLMRKRESIGDLTAFLRRCKPFSADDYTCFFEEYLSFNDLNVSVEELLKRFYRRKKTKEAR